MLMAPGSDGGGGGGCGSLKVPGDWWLVRLGCHIRFVRRELSATWDCQGKESKADEIRR